MAESKRRAVIPPSCGARCLALVLERLGTPASAEELAAVCDERPELASMSGLARAARGKGVAAQPAEWSPQELQEASGKYGGRVLLHLQRGADRFGGHYVILEQFDGHVCCVSDPQAPGGGFIIPLVKLEEWWSGKVLILGPVEASGKKAVSKPKGPAKAAEKSRKKSKRPSKRKRKRGKR